MKLIIQKFGGTSVANIERIKHVAKIIAKAAQYNQVIVVISAMAGMTNSLVEYTDSLHTISNAQEIAEYDTVIAAGEQITIGLVALALMALGLKSQSYLGWQLPILTTSVHAAAKIVDINTYKLFANLKEDIIPIIAGFQGVHNNRVTTLGRGGSDTTAVAVAAATKAMRCDIYTDVDGIYTADPRVVLKANKIPQIDYNSALEIASSGAQMIHPRAIEIAMQYNIPVTILNTFSTNTGTLIISNHIQDMEKTIITGIAIKQNLALITINSINIDDINQLFNSLIDIGIIIDAIMQSHIHFDPTDLEKTLCNYTITIPAEQLGRTINAINKLYIIHTRVALTKISIIGIGIKNDHTILKVVLGILKNIAIFPISMQLLETQLSFMIEQTFAEQTVRNLHTKFGLDIQS